MAVSKSRWANKHLAKAELQGRRESFVITRANWNQAVQLFGEGQYLDEIIRELAPETREFTSKVEHIYSNLIKDEPRFSMFGDISNYDAAIERHEYLTKTMRNTIGTNDKTRHSSLELKLAERDEVQKIWDEKVYNFFVYKKKWPKQLAKRVAPHIPLPKQKHHFKSKIALGYFCAVPYRYIHAMGTVTGINPRELSKYGSWLGFAPVLVLYAIHETLKFLHQNTIGGPVPGLYDMIGLGDVMSYATMLAAKAKIPVTVIRIAAAYSSKRHIPDPTLPFGGEPVEAYFNTWMFLHDGMVKAYRFFGKKYDPETSIPLRDTMDWMTKKAYASVGQKYMPPSPEEREQKKQVIEQRKLERKAIRDQKIANTYLLNTPALPLFTSNYDTAGFR